MKYLDELVMIWWNLNQGLMTHHQERWRNGMRDEWRFYGKADTRSRQSCSACFFSILINSFSVIILQISIFIYYSALSSCKLTQKFDDSKSKNRILPINNLSYMNSWSHSRIICNTKTDEYSQWKYEEVNFIIFLLNCNFDEINVIFVNNVRHFCIFINY